MTSIQAKTLIQKVGKGSFVYTLRRGAVLPIELKFEQRKRQICQMPLVQHKICHNTHWGRFAILEWFLVMLIGLELSQIKIVLHTSRGIKN